MPYIRKNVWELGGDWADPILWYARGVKSMQTRDLDELTGWRFYGAIHGFDQGLWQQHGYWSPAETMPSNADQKRFWSQCQHGSWYFLPWHRGYLLAFEANLRAEVVKLGGPADWALPYWNYFKANEFKLPAAFASPDWPDGTGNNPLYIQQRYGPDGDRNVYVPLDQVNLDALSDNDFIGAAAGGSLGFGGPKTSPLFHHEDGRHGGIETQPHDQVHGLVGGSDPKNPNFLGLMSDPDTAGLDPIFWLHHANIDRLWEVWVQNPSTNVNPPDPDWQRGPASKGERKFSMPMPGGVPWDYTPADMAQVVKAGYDYDDLSPTAPAPQPGQRLLRLGASTAIVDAMKGVAAVASVKNVELIGANEAPMKIEGNEVSTSVRIDASMRRKVAASLAMDVGAPVPDRVFLNLENIRGLDDSTILQVYVDVPEGASAANHPELRAGSVALFGLRKASLPDGPHAGQGLTLGLEITKIVDELHLTDALDVDSLGVRIVPRKSVPEAAQISIGRVSLFRQGR